MQSSAVQMAFYMHTYMYIRPLLTADFGFKNLLITLIFFCPFLNSIFVPFLICLDLYYIIILIA